MTTRMVDLPEYQKSAEIFFIGSGNANDLQSICPALVDGKLNSTGHDLALLFSSSDKASAYRDCFPSMRRFDIFQASVYEMIEIVGGKVEYFTIDNVPEKFNANC